MEDTQHPDFERIAEAITFIQQNFREQPRLEDIAKEVHVSPAHFQRIFTEWAGTSPKKFLQYISVDYARRLLREDHATLAQTTHQTGLSSTSRLHDLFVSIEGMTPAEFRNNGQNLVISYDFAPSPFGELIIASTTKGVCYLAFPEDPEAALTDLHHRFPEATLQHGQTPHHTDALKIFSQDGGELSKIKLHLKGTPFQLKVWEALLTIPAGSLTTYGSIADKVQNSGASRAVGTAIGSNPVSYLIPCHRVIQSTGIFGGYHWGPMRKTAMIGWEAARRETSEV
jgi:AraC family transcriptional regulator of adaptative response/methylated-DNA-[protein]-cysteine methyltransferase